MDTNRVSRVGSKQPVQPWQPDTLGRDSASDSPRLLTRESMLEVEGEEAEEAEEEAEEEAVEGGEWCSTWCICERVCMAVMI